MPDRRSGVALPLLTGRLGSLARVVGEGLAGLGRTGARALVRSARRWAAATRAAAREQLFATSAALEVSEAALAGEQLHELSQRIARLARELSGAAEASVFARSAGGLVALSHPESAPHLLALAARAFQSGEAEETPQDGHPRALALPLRAGEVTAGVLVLSAPPGKRVRHRGLSPLLQRAGAALASAERQASKDRFLSFAAHELKTPLTTIKGYAYSLARRMERGEPADPRAIEVLERQAERLHGLLEEMLEVSRLETGRFVLHNEPCDLSELFESAVRALKRLGGDVLTADEPLGPLPLLADRDRLERALVALTLHARALGQPVRTTAERHRGAVRLRIAWSGPPLAEAARAHAFGPRWELPVQERLGLGMALSVAQRVLHLHGGALRAEESAFVLELPLREAREVPLALGASVSALVVDDDEAIAGMLTEFLAENGFAADMATGGLAALEKMREAPPDLLVLDLRMPEMDGRALLLEARRRGHAPRVVLLSADREVAQAAQELGADAFVEKPFSPEGLLAAVRRVMPAPAVLSRK